MSRIYAKALGFAAFLSLLSPGTLTADDSVPRPRATNPAKMSCRDMIAFSNSQNNKLGTTTWQFFLNPFQFKAEKSKTNSSQYCATADSSKLSVTKNITSVYWVWAVVDGEKNCQAAADEQNAAIKRFEQQHIDDVNMIVKDQTAKYRAAVDDKLKTPVCNSDAGKALADLGKSLSDIQKKIKDDAQKALDDAQKSRDDSGSHTYKVNCSCAQ
jgi:hypothetical protein